MKRKHECQKRQLVDILLFSDNTVFEEMLANMRIFSLNIIENSVNILGKVLYRVVLLRLKTRDKFVHKFEAII